MSLKPSTWFVYSFMYLLVYVFIHLKVCVEERCIVQRLAASSGADTHCKQISIYLLSRAAVLLPMHGHLVSSHQTLD